MSDATSFAGKPCCTCLGVWLPAYERELLARKVIRRSLDVYQLTGTVPQSAGTHKGGAFDLGQTSLEAIMVARQMGADATWHRPAGWDGGTGISHSHGVLTGCPHNGAAAYQIAAVRAGFNGLGAGGRGGPDTGPRPLSGRTFAAGIVWHRAQHQKRARLARIAVEVTRLRARIVLLKSKRKALL